MFCLVGCVGNHLSVARLSRRFWSGIQFVCIVSVNLCGQVLVWKVCCCMSSLSKNSLLAINLVKNMMDPDPNVRLSAKQILRHPWVDCHMNKKSYFFEKYDGKVEIQPPSNEKYKQRYSAF